MANIYQDPAMKKVLARIIRSRMDLAGMTYKTLCQALRDKFSIEHNPATLRNKVSTGSLGAQMFLFMMMAMDVDDISMEEVEKLYRRIGREYP